MKRLNWLWVIIYVGACGGTPPSAACPEGSIQVGERCRPIACEQERCDGEDNDCDGRVDESLTRSCGDAIGACTVGNEMCSAGEWMGCDAVMPIEEDCETPADDDCDGEANEGCGCEAGETMPCGTDEGTCALGTATCQADGSWGLCEGDVGPGVEICDGLDNDCDGTSDEDIAPTPCGVEIGECQQGMERCVDGALTCVGAIDPETEVCDGHDNDCDGETDFSGEGYCAFMSEAVACMTVCGSIGTGACTDACTTPTAADCMVPEETCSYADDDCDGAVDEGVRVFTGPGSSVDAGGHAPALLAADRPYVVGMDDGNLVVWALDDAGSPMADSREVLSTGRPSAFHASLSADGNRLVVGWIAAGGVYGAVYGTSGGLSRAGSARLATVPDDAGVATLWHRGRAYFAFTAGMNQLQVVRTSSMLLDRTFYDRITGASGAFPSMALSVQDDAIVVTAFGGLGPTAYEVTGSSTLRLMARGGAVSLARDEMSSVGAATGPRLVAGQWDGELHLVRFDALGSATSLAEAVTVLNLDRKVYALHHHDGVYVLFYLTPGRNLMRARLNDTLTGIEEAESLGRFGDAAMLSVQTVGLDTWVLVGTADGSRVHRLGCF